jgi:hypothetical protein
MEGMLHEAGTPDMRTLSLEELDAAWERAKQSESGD